MLAREPSARATTGALSRETQPARRGRPSSCRPRARRDVDRARERPGRDRADETRASSYGGLAADARGDVVVWEPVDEEELGVTPPAVPQPGHPRRRVGFSVAGFGAALPRLPLAAQGLGGFGGKIERGQAQRHPRLRPVDTRRRSTCPRRAPTSSRTRSTTRPRSRPRRRSTARSSTPAWSRASSRCTSGACTSAAACRGARRSQWFECPCHGSKYNRVGEKKAGPAPRGLDRFHATQSRRGSIAIDTGNIFLGPPIGTNTTGQNAEGPLCV